VPVFSLSHRHTQKHTDILLLCRWGGGGKPCTYAVTHGFGQPLLADAHPVGHAVSPAHISQRVQCVHTVWRVYTYTAALSVSLSLCVSVCPSLSLCVCLSVSLCVSACVCVWRRAEDALLVQVRDNVADIRNKCLLITERPTLVTSLVPALPQQTQREGERESE
jgi:hypothetical protein